MSYIILYAFIRAIFAYIVLMVVIRIMGRKSVSEMTFFDFAAALTLGTLAASVGMGSDTSFYSALTVLLTFGILGIISDHLHLKLLSFNKLINSEPLVIIENGEIIKKNMKRARLALSDLTSLLREKNQFNIGNVQFAILERNGKLSVLPKAATMPLTPVDMQLSPPENGLTKDLIIDGKLMAENLKPTSITEKWLINELKAKGIGDIKDVFYAALDTSGQLYIYKGGSRLEKPGQHGIE